VEQIGFNLGGKVWNRVGNTFAVHTMASGATLLRNFLSGSQVKRELLHRIPFLFIGAASKEEKK
jgi:hypothetical protein